MSKPQHRITRALGTVAVALAVALAVGGCITTPPPAVVPPDGVDVPSDSALASGSVRRSAAGRFTDTANAELAVGDRIAWVALAGGVPTAAISALAAFEIREQGGARALVSGRGGEAWRIEQRGRTLRVAGGDGDATPWRPGPFVVRTGRSGTPVAYDGSRYRGELWITPTDSGLLVVNRLPVEDYLRGVVPLELGTRASGDAAALQAQAIAARSYSYVRVPEREEIPKRGYHLTATVLHQVYGGVKVEHPVVDAAIAATTGLVLRYRGAVVDGPYSSSCGGRTAVPSEAWAGEGDHGYLHSVSDIDAATGRAFCDLSPRNSWTVTFDEPLLRQAIVRHLGSRGARGSTAPVVSEVGVRRRSGSGRVAVLEIKTDRGMVSLDGREIRAAFRDARGAILFSTYFDVVRTTRSGARVSAVELRGVGNGHGVGMCQWGAIGRARAGHDVRAILRHYYPGTVVGFAE